MSFCSRMAEEEGVPAPAADPVSTLVVQGVPKPAGGDAPKEESSLDDMVDLDSAALFSTRRPKDVSAGMASGAKTIMKGVVAGAIGLVAAPVMGAREEGVKGFVKGMGMGVAGAIALPVAGTILGCVQVTRGALNTPDAIKQRKAGKVWDEDTRQWVVYNLREEARELLSTSYSSPSPSPSPNPRRARRSCSTTCWTTARMTSAPRQRHSAGSAVPHTAHCHSSLQLSP